MSSVESQRLLKAENNRALGMKVAFNYEDFRNSCDTYLQQAKEEGRKIIEAALQEAEAIRHQAGEEARQYGYTEGTQEADEKIDRRAKQLATQRVAEQLGTILPTINAVAQSLEKERDQWLINWETNAIQLCVGIAEKVLRTKLRTTPEIANKLILETIQQLSGQANITIRINPTDKQNLGEHAEKVVENAAACGAVTLVADAEISSGGCLIETQRGVIDAQIETQLERIAAELIQEPA